MSKTYETPALKTYGRLVELTKGNDGYKEDSGIYKVQAP
ncbi:MAG: lasso RiPP family leader peptide-containing protein [Anaerolineales bacterium]|nr:lasso RiPP family leader peptide-containing protein [Anaerolineales bacterium]MCB9127912.1 lasso RiPP family leader peptide-containing protein [Ardenticatenales bacterium]MCB9171674.1 lasso RiPP family leader peptide-containing protein [Ardenticatenales bacterium]